jgi:hypothetical protein
MHFMFEGEKENDDEEDYIYEVGKGATSATSLGMRQLRCNIFCNAGATTCYIFRFSAV